MLEYTKTIDILLFSECHKLYKTKKRIQYEQGRVVATKSGNSTAEINNKNSVRFVVVR